MNFLFDEPLVCRVHVHSDLPIAELSHYVTLDVCSIDWAGHSNVLILSGRLTDQAALMGLVNTLYSLQLVILSIECRLEGDPIQYRRKS